MKHFFYAENEKCILAPLEEKHIELLRTWRNDPTLSRFLRPIAYITAQEEQKWFKHYQEDRTTIFFIVIDRTTSRSVGTVALYDIEGSKCEIGKIVIGDPSAHGKGLGYNAVCLAIHIAFEKLNIEELRLDVHSDNIAALTIYSRVGFEICGMHDFICGGHELEMRITRKRFLACNPDYDANEVDRSDVN